MKPLPWATRGGSNDVLCNQLRMPRISCQMTCCVTCPEGLDRHPRIGCFKKGGYSCIVSLVGREVSCLGLNGHTCHLFEPAAKLASRVEAHGRTRRADSNQLVSLYGRAQGVTQPDLGVTAPREAVTVDHGRHPGRTCDIRVRGLVHRRPTNEQDLFTTPAPTVSM